MNSPNKAFIICLTAVIFLTVLSFLPWDKLTGNYFKRFNLFGDLFPKEEQIYVTNEILDPELEKLEETQTAPQVSEVENENRQIEASASAQKIVVPTDTFIVPRKEGLVLIEDYSPNGNGLAILKSNLELSKSELVRFAIIGDSYIEGDIFAQDIRAYLQTKYGGQGVGYMPAYCEFPGFRQSVRQSGSGWSSREIRDMKSGDLRILQGLYHFGEAGATSLYKGSKRPAHCDSWNSSILMFVAPDSGNIVINGADGYSVTHSVSASPNVQVLRYDQTTSKFGFTSSIDSLRVLGVWLNATTGIALDNMSLRGNSGVSHRRLNATIIEQMRRTIDYKLIILEFGINALSSEQTNYNAYASAMTSVVGTIKKCYPNAQIMIMGIGDRGQKQGAEVGSMATTSCMVNALRNVAKVTGSLFWDTREAMGGDGAVVEWHNKGLINSDYVHLNHKGGKELAEIFIQSLNASIDE